MTAKTITTNDVVVSRTAPWTGQTLTAVLSMVACIGLLTGIAGAQDLPAAPVKPPTPPPLKGAYSWPIRVGLACGGGASTSSVGTTPTAQCGGILSLPIFEFEAGVMGPQANRSSVSGYLSTNAWIPLVRLRDLSPAYVNGKNESLRVVGGYTRMFEIGHALDYGVTYARPIDESHSIQFEARDYWAFANPSQHNLVFRVAWLSGGDIGD